MRILIDADGCPVVNQTIETAKQFEIEVYILCDTSHTFQRPGVNTIVVSKGADSVDFALVNMVLPGDIAVTQDYGLAAMCLAREAIPINQDGMVYDENNIDSLLLSRHTAKKIRNSGGRLKGPKKRTSAQDQVFTASLEKLILNNL
ncbi:MAG: YaiI/YqxD family protein [Bacillota bacterium]|nr:YaiI/YqxD family protein [Bacillota bacterium]